MSVGYLKNIMLCAIVVSASVPSISLAQDNDAPILDCVPLSRVDKSEIIDNSTIYFHMRDGLIYVVNLNFECPSLKFDDSFYYNVRGMRLCPTDVITNRSGFTCPIESIDVLEEEQP